MDNVSSCGWHLDHYRSFIVPYFLDDKTHLFSAVSYLSHIQRQAERPVNVGQLHVKFIRLQVRENAPFTSFSLVMNFDLLDGELALALAVARELSREDGKTNLKLVEVSSGQLNEDILRVEGDLGCLTVNDGRKREHLAGSIVEDGVAGLVLYDVEILLQLLVIL